MKPRNLLLFTVLVILIPACVKRVETPRLGGWDYDWPYEQISGWNQTEDNLALLIRRAAHIYNREDYQQYWEDNFYDRTKSDWDLLVFPGY